MGYVISLAVGAVVGVVYGLIGVRSPAPPLVALAGLLGMVGGEQAVPIVKAWIMPAQKQATSAAPTEHREQVPTDRS